jgi:hypothetical protein
VACLRIGDVPSIQGEFKKVNRDSIATRHLLLVLASIVVLIGLLVYSEATIRDFKKLENDRAHLYANLYGLAVSSDVSDQLAAVIFRDIIQSPKVNFPLIVTNADGDIEAWKGCGVADFNNQSSQETMQELKSLIQEMDQINQPIPLYFSGESFYLLH